MSPIGCNRLLLAGALLGALLLAGPAAAKLPDELASFREEFERRYASADRETIKRVDFAFHLLIEKHMADAVKLRLDKGEALYALFVEHDAALGAADASYIAYNGLLPSVRGAPADQVADLAGLFRRKVAEPCGRLLAHFGPGLFETATRTVASSRTSQQLGPEDNSPRMIRFYLVWALYRLCGAALAYDPREFTADDLQLLAGDPAAR